MPNDPFIRDLCELKHDSHIHPMVYGYLKGWLLGLCDRSLNGQISAAQVRSTLVFLDAAIEMAYVVHHSGRDQ